MLPKKFRRMVALYRLFAPEASTLDFSDAALRSLFEHESYGKALSSNNGFAYGKQYLNLHVSTWKEDIEHGLLWKFELYEDPKFAQYHWWLDSVFRWVPGPSQRPSGHSTSISTGSSSSTTTSVSSTIGTN